MDALKLIDSARRVVRETAIVAQRTEAQHRSGFVPQRREDQIRLNSCQPNSLYSHILLAHATACAHLRQLDPNGAEEFIKSIYGKSYERS